MTPICLKASRLPAGGAGCLAGAGMQAAAIPCDLKWHSFPPRSEKRYWAVLYSFGINSLSLLCNYLWLFTRVQNMKSLIITRVENTLIGSLKPERTQGLCPEPRVWKSTSCSSQLCYLLPGRTRISHYSQNKTELRYDQRNSGMVAQCSEAEMLSPVRTANHYNWILNCFVDHVLAKEPGIGRLMWDQRNVKAVTQQVRIRADSECNR